MEIIWYVLIVLALIIIGTVAVVKFVYRKGKSGYKRGKEAIQDRRDRNRGAA